MLSSLFDSHADPASEAMSRRESVGEIVIWVTRQAERA